MPTITEYMITPNFPCGNWSSISIPTVGNALVVSSVNGHIETAELDNFAARNTIDWLRERPNDYTVTIVRGN